MKHETYTCDIANEVHGNSEVKLRKVPVMFDHDQEDGKSKQTPYFQLMELDVCESCFKFMTENRKVLYAYGAMGHNTYTF